MATLPPGAGGGGGGLPAGRGGGLDAPPPTLGQPPAPGGPQPPAGVTAGAPPGARPEDAVSTVLEMGRQLDALLLMLSENIPVSREEFGRARELIEMGMAKAIAGTSPGQAPSGPVEAGNQFPGGLQTPTTDFR